MSTPGGNQLNGQTEHMDHYTGDQRKFGQPQYGGGATKSVSGPMLIAAFIVVASLIGGGVYFFGFRDLGALNAAPTFKPTPLPTLVRAPSSPYVVVTFTSPPTTPTTVVAAFDAAAVRWSTILAGTLLTLGTIDPNSTFNEFDCALVNDTIIPKTNIDQLHIAAEIGGIDGKGGILGGAGPCRGFVESIDRPGIFLPVLGQMVFDVEDLGDLVISGRLEDVILHEMGHVLGIGTLWSQLVVDQVFPFGLPVRPFNSPRYVGHGARAEFQSLSGSTGDIPVEDGSFQNLSPSQLAAGNGKGSVDGHWRENVFEAELMTPVIDITNNPMSLMTLRSLEDLGYAVDTSEADTYTIPSSSVSSARTSRREHPIVLHGDIFHCPTLAKGLEQARTRARKHRRLGGATGISLHDG